MHFSTLLGLAASVASTQALSQGFNYGNTLTDGSAKQESDFEAEFKRAQTLQGTTGFTSARIYTMIQSGTTNTPIAAIQAAINTKTTLLLGMWASAGQDAFSDEIAALKSAIQQYGSDFTDLVVGLSVGSEDLYRVSPTGIENDSGLGATPDELVSYIKQARQAIQGTSLSSTTVGHVDTWTAYVNGSNSAVIDACDWLGMDTYPYFESTVDNSIENSNKTFWDAYDATAGAGKGKEVWITETGWPVSGKTVGQAVPSVQNAETYWQEVACTLIGNYNTWWYTLQDAEPTTPDPSFGIVSSDLNSQPAYSLACKKQPTVSSSHNSTSSSSSSSSTSTGHSDGTSSGQPNGGPYSNNGTSSGQSGSSTSNGNGSGSSTANGGASTSSGAAGSSASNTNDATKAGSAIGAAILAIFALVATL